jgi:hypothetical protein
MHEELYSRQAHTELMAHGEVLWNSINHAEAGKTGCILATAAWVEALANLVFTLRLKKDEFEAIDRLNIIDKWTVMMPFVVPAFSLPKEGQLFQALRELIYDRNALTHAKPMATEGDTIVHKGQSPKYSIGKHDAVIRKLREWVALPKALVQELRKADQDLAKSLWLFSGYMQDELRNQKVKSPL